MRLRSKQKKKPHATRTLGKIFCRRHAMRFNAISLATGHSSRPIRPYKHVRVQRIECVVVVNGVNCSTRSVMKALSISQASALFFLLRALSMTHQHPFHVGTHRVTDRTPLVYLSTSASNQPHTLLLLWFWPILIDLMPHCH